MSSPVKKHTLLKLFALASVAALLSAQTTSTEVLGSVKDPSGPSSRERKSPCSARRPASGVSTTTSSGDFSFPLIEPGNYTVTVDAAGFKTEQKTGVEVAYQQKARVDFSVSVVRNADCRDRSRRGDEDGRRGGGPGGG